MRLATNVTPMFFFVPKIRPEIQDLFDIAAREKWKFGIGTFSCEVFSSTGTETYPYFRFYKTITTCSLWLKRDNIIELNSFESRHLQSLYLDYEKAERMERLDIEKAYEKKKWEALRSFLSLHS